MSARTPSFADVRPVLASMFGKEPDHARTADEGAYSPAGRWVVRWSDGRSAFVKAEWDASDRHGTAMEHLVYANVTAPPIPELFGYDAGSHDRPRVLVTEDLSSAAWGPPIRRRDAELFSEAVAHLERVAPPEGLPDTPAALHWETIAADPSAVVASGLLDATWVERHGYVLLAAEATADPRGDRLVHGDLWLQNWCRAPRGVVMVDWSACGRGSLDVARAWGEAAVRAAGGPGGVIMPPGSGGWAAWMAARTARYLADDRDHPNVRLVDTLRREALASLRWACDELGIEPPRQHPGFEPGPWRP